MEFRQGRLLDHGHLRVRDLEWSRRFYQAALGRERSAPSVMITLRES